MDTAGWQTLLVKGYGKVLSDAVMRTVEVVPDGKRVEESWSGTAQGTVTHDVAFPADTVPNSPDVYLKVHRSGPKRDMANRLQGCRRALRAGFEGIGLGILLGLAPVRNDLARLARHAHMLLREFPGTRLGFSLPRIQDAVDAQDDLLFP